MIRNKRIDLEIRHIVVQIVSINGVGEVIVSDAGYQNMKV